MDINNLINRLNELESLLSSYEVMIDKGLYNHLLSEYNSINGIMDAHNNGDNVLAEKLMLGHKKIGHEVVAIEGADKKIIETLNEYGFVFKEDKKLLIASGIGVSEVLKKFDRAIFYPYQSGEYEFELKDVRVDVFHASGAGGQNVNKVETAIRATHMPSGLSVVCQDERSQGRNKDKAIQRLKVKLMEHYKKEAQKNNKTARNNAVKN